jgi:hypothetical protein
VGPENLFNYWCLILKKGYEITNTKSGIKLNIYLGPLPEPWKRPRALRLKLR